MMNKIIEYVKKNNLDGWIILTILVILIINEFLIWERVKIFFIILWILWSYNIIINKIRKNIYIIEEKIVNIYI